MNSHYFEREQFIQNDQYFNNKTEHFLSPPVSEMNNNYKDNSQHQFPMEPYNQPTPTLPINHSPNIRSILRQKNKNYENQSKQNWSPLLNTHLTRDIFQCNKSHESKKSKFQHRY